MKDFTINQVSEYLQWRIRGFLIYEVFRPRPNVPESMNHACDILIRSWNVLHCLETRVENGVVQTRMVLRK